MTQHIKRNFRNGSMLLTPIFLLTSFLLTLSSCTADGGGSTGGTCTKCIDNKPAPTPFANTLNGINHNIPISQAVTMIDNYNVVRETMLAKTYADRNTLPVYETFNLKAIDTLICQKNAVGFRVYMAMDAQQQVRFVLVGVDGDGKDVIQRTKEDPARGLTFDPAVSVLVEEAGQRWP